MNFFVKKCKNLILNIHLRTLLVLLFSIFFFEGCNFQVSLKKSLNPDSLTTLVPTVTPTPTPSPTPTPVATVYPGTLHEISFQTTKGRDEPRESIVFGDYVYFTSLTPNGAKIFKVKNQVVTQVSNTNPGGDDNPQHLTVIGSYLYFTAFSGTG
jgi:hypothetical protein